jgi:hypothetical protein
MRPDDAAELHLGRRGFLGSASGLAAASLLGGRDAQASAQATASRRAAHATERRRLGKLEVSMLALSGVEAAR